MKPLQGIRIVTLESFAAAPYGTMMLADLGAEVIKVENPAVGGDASRQVGPHRLGDNDSQYSQSFNLNKKSVTLDLTQSEDCDNFRNLVATADAVVNNLRGDLPVKLGLDYASLCRIKPSIVCLHISAYGRDNERAGWPGYDFLAQAEAGLMSMTGDPDGPPCRIGLSMIDYMTGITGMVGLLSCLMRARTTGVGGNVDTNLFDVAAHQHCYAATWYLNSGVAPERMKRGGHASVVPVQSVKTADGWIYVMCMKEKFWHAFAARIGRPDLVADPRFAMQDVRRENRDALTEELDAAMSARSTDEWLSLLSGVVPVAPINSVEQAFSNRFLIDSGMITSVEHPECGDLRVLSSPIKIDGQRPPKSACSPLGADNKSLLGAIRQPQIVA